MSTSYSFRSESSMKTAVFLELSEKPREPRCTRFDTHSQKRDIDVNRISSKDPSVINDKRMI